MSLSAGDSAVLLQLSLWLYECVILVVIKLSVKSAMQRLKEPGLLTSSLAPFIAEALGASNKDEILS